MAFVEKDGLRYFQFDSLAQNTIHGIFTRHGGVSPEPWGSLNLGGTVGDERANVRENRLRMFRGLDRDPASVFDLWQVHGTQTSFATEPRQPDAHEEKGDILFTDRPEITLYMRFADCTPLLFHDPQRSVVGIAHAGWLGTVRGVATAAVRAMSERYGSNPAEIRAGIGPSIGPDHYEVGQDVVEKVHQVFGDHAASLLPRVGEQIHFDLWAANRLQLEQAGVRQIEVAEICTACHLDDWYSHRAEKGKTGRFGALIALRR